MWKIFRYKNNELNMLRKDIEKKFDKDYQIYIPTILLQNKNNKNKILKKINIMGDYLFCFHKKFSDNKYRYIINNLKGLKISLSGEVESQNDIIKFIKRCKNKEDANGYLHLNFYEIDPHKDYKFYSGPFNNTIFKIIEIQKNKIDILLGKLKIKLSKNNYFYQPV